MKVKSIGHSLVNFLFSRKFSLIIYLITIILAVCLRVNQLLSNMDFSTGKYINQSFSKDYPAIVIILGLLIILLILIFGNSTDRAIKTCILLNPYKLKADRLNKRQKPATGVVFLVMALLIAMEVFFNISSVIQKNLDLSTEDNKVFILAGMGGMQWTIIIFEIIAVITFLTAGYNVLKGEGISKGNAFFFAIYGIMRVFQAFSFFAQVPLISSYSEKIYILFTYILSGVFIVSLVRFVLETEKKNTKLILCLSAYATSIVAAVSVIPRYLMFFMIDYNVRDGMVLPDISDLGWIFVPVVFISLFFGEYVYRIMPKLNITGKRRWSRATVNPQQTMADQ